MVNALFSRLARVLAPVLFAAMPAMASETLLKADQLSQLGALGWFVPNLKVAPAPAGNAMIGSDNKDPGFVLLRRLIAQGRAAGFEGVLYDNRDRGHSTLKKTDYPALSHLVYGPKLLEQQLDYGLGGQIILPSIVIGNSSTAIETRKIARSQTRLAMTAPLGPERAYLTYANNHVYVYPEHRDHDAADRFPANWPYTITSQGSSFSDQPFLNALALSVAAFTPETRDFLLEKRLVAPTLSMILRRSLKGIYKREDYFSAAAHPTVFNGDLVAAERMVSLASSIKPGDVPPMVQLSVVSEDFKDRAGLMDLTERLFDTPSAIARVWRAPDYSRQITISVADTRDPNGRDLTYRWVVLNGDPEKVRISQIDAAGERALVRIDWHDRRFVGKGKGRAIDRVDIGVFANNGVHDSAPAILSISFPTHQNRAYVELAGGREKKLASIDYAAGQRGEYFDPLVHWHADWRDDFTYASDGTMETWQRTRTDGKEFWLKHPDPSRVTEFKFSTKKSSKGPKLLMKKIKKK